MIIKDHLHRELVIDKIPRRIVSLVPSQTELLCDLGLEDKIVGITKFCVHPVHLRKTKTIVGGTKKVHYDRIKALDPDIILCNKEENTLEMVQELEKIAPVHVSDIINYKDALQIIEDYGGIFDRKLPATELLKDLKGAKENFEREIGKIRLKVAYFIWREPWMLAGRDTFINTLLELNNWENVVVGQSSRYPEIDLKDLGELQPDLILLSSEPFPFKEKHKKEILGQYKNAGVELVDGEFFSWYGSRLLPAFKYFREFQKHLSSSL